MAIYKVQGPDGAIHKFEGPDDATPAQIEAAAGAQFSAAKPAPVAAPVQPSAPAQKPGMLSSVLQYIAHNPITDSAPMQAGVDFLMGGVKGKLDPVLGSAQLATHAASTVIPALSGVSNGLDHGINKFEQNYQAATPGSFSAGLGRGVGNMTIPMGGAVVKGAGYIPNIVNGVAMGAKIGATQPVLNAGENFYTDKAKQVGAGAGLGGAFGGLGAAAGTLYNTVRPIVSPSSVAGNQIYQNLVKSAAAETKNGALQNDVTGLVSSDPASVLASLKARPQYVPGSKPTTAQVAKSAELVMAEKAMKVQPAYTAAFMQRDAANNGARMAAVKNVAKTPAELEAAIAARKAAADPLYNEFGSQPVAIDENMRQILETPIGKDAVTRARGSMANEIPPKPFNYTQPSGEQQVASSIVDASGKPLSTTTIPAQPGGMDGDAANTIKKSIDEMRRNPTPADSSMVRHDATSLENIRRQFVQNLDANNPIYQQARDTYAQMSTPVTTMQAGQDLEKALSGKSLNYLGEEGATLPRYAGALQKVENGLKYPIDPEALTSLQNVHKDLQLRSVSDSLPKTGSDTVWNAQAPNWLSGKLFGQNLDGNSLVGKGIGGGLGMLFGDGVISGLAGGAAAQKIGTFTGNRVNSSLQDAMMNPEVFQKLLEDAMARNAGSNVNNLSPLVRSATSQDAGNVGAANP